MTFARIIEIVDSDTEDGRSFEDILTDAEQQLKVPFTFASQDWSEASNAHDLLLWRNNSSSILENFHKKLQKEDIDSLDHDWQVRILAITIPFRGQGAWVKPEARSSAQSILAIIKTKPEHSRYLLLNVIKPRFDKAIPHPSLNVETGRRLLQPAGGDDAFYPMDENQVWKLHPDTLEVLVWCLESVEPDDWESLWPLVIPPVMAFLDDHELKYRLAGALIAQKLIQSVSQPLLDQTGIGILVEKSLGMSLLQFQDALAPALFRAASKTYMILINKMIKCQSQQYFDKYFVLIGDHIIGGAWTYGYRDPSILGASYDVLCEVIPTIGISCARFLKALIPQLAYAITPRPFVNITSSLLVSAIRALRAIVVACPQRIGFWKGEIMSGIVKCWVELHEGQSSLIGSETVKMELVELCQDLATARPELHNIDYPEILALDPTLFEPLILRHAA